jgi:hypothetical protein
MMESWLHLNKLKAAKPAENFWGFILGRNLAFTYDYGIFEAKFSKNLPKRKVLGYKEIGRP